MKLNNLQTLKELKSVGSLPSIKPMIYKRIRIDKSRLSAIDLIQYSTNLCLFSARILRNEIQVKNRNETLNAVIQEVSKLYNLLSKDDLYMHSEYTKKDTKAFFKHVGLKPKHVSTN